MIKLKTIQLSDGKSISIHDGDILTEATEYGMKIIKHTYKDKNGRSRVEWINTNAIIKLED